MQFSLKKATTDGDECPDGQKPAKSKRGRKLSANPKAKAKSTAKKAAKNTKNAENPKTPKTRKHATKPKASPKAKGTKRGKMSEVDHETDGVGVPVGEPEPSKPLNKRAKPDSVPTGESSSAKTKPGRRTASGEQVAKKVEKTEKGEKGGKGEVKKLKCFAKRRRPTTQSFGQLKWDALHTAFEQKIKPHLKSYSAHEDY